MDFSVRNHEPYFENDNIYAASKVLKPNADIVVDKDNSGSEESNFDLPELPQDKVVALHESIAKLSPNCSSDCKRKITNKLSGIDIEQWDHILNLAYSVIPNIDSKKIINDMYGTDSYVQFAKNLDDHNESLLIEVIGFLSMHSPDDRTLFANTVNYICEVGDTTCEMRLGILKDLCLYHPIKELKELNMATAEERLKFLKSYTLSENDKGWDFRRKAVIKI